MDIVKYINENKQTVKVETDKGHTLREILTCPICRTPYNDRTELYEHICNGHVNFSFAVCHLCGKRCRGPGALRSHMYLHSTSGIFMCTIIGCNVRSSSIG